MRIIQRIAVYSCVSIFAISLVTAGNTDNDSDSENQPKTDELVTETKKDTSFSTSIQKDTNTVSSTFEHDHELCDHYHILYDECRIEPEVFIETSESCLDNPYLETMKADSAFWMSISPFFTTFDHKRVNPYITKGTKMKYLSDTIKIVLYDSSSKEKGWSMPLSDYNNRITSGFKYRRYRWHKGTDLDLVTGDSVFAVFDGVVRIAGYNRGGYGHYVLVRHYNGLETVYGHLSKKTVCPGQPVKAGELLGLGGNTGRSTGSHLHFETRFRGIAFDSQFMYDYANKKLKSRELVLLPKYFTYVNGLAYYAPNGKMYHRIRRGDTLGGIARRYRTYVSTLCRLNGIRSTTILRVGRNIRVR